MDMSKITVSLRPCSGWRVVAKKCRRGSDELVHYVKKLQRREISSKCHHAFYMSNAYERFRNICLQVHFSYTNSSTNQPDSVLPKIQQQHFIYSRVEAAPAATVAEFSSV
ncbi:unnamed protein product [Fraxinus pennsylvanica]|uniref:Uncharacterized protein n=1 Tax=Fraxinus pennsylvanica TaxID=56036 RepID=A0AAD1ZMY9_9LAMI|nr:unnamed protein product [Fraxinus pennsylvanica]